jgi:hypothetical protein
MSLNSVKAKVQKLLAAVKPAIPKRARLVLYTVPDTAAEEEREAAKAEALARWQVEHPDYGGAGTRYLPVLGGGVALNRVKLNGFQSRGFVWLG